MFTKNKMSFITLLFLFSIVSGQMIDIKSLDPKIMEQILESGVDPSSLNPDNLSIPNQILNDDTNSLVDDPEKTKNQVSEILKSEKTLNDAIDNQNTVTTEIVNDR